MKRYLFTTIAAVAALAAVIVGVIVVVAVRNDAGTNGSGQSSDSASSSKYAKLFSVSYSYVEEIENYTNEQLLSLKRETVINDSGRETKVWVCTSDSSVEANTSNVNSLVSSILSSSASVIEERGELSEYGFDENGRSNLYVRVRGRVNQSSELIEETVYVGSFDYSRNYRYVCIDDGKLNVYKLGVYSVDRLLFQKGSIVLLKAFPFLSSDVPRCIKVYERGEKVLETECVSIDVQATQDQKRVIGLWEMRYPIARKANDNNVNTILSDLNGVVLQSVAATGVTEDRLADYGLSPPAIEYYLNVISPENGNEEQNYLIKIGNKTPEGDEYYCIADNGADGKYEIYTISTGAVYRSLNPVDYMDSYLFLEDSDLLSSIDVEVYGEEKYTMRYEYEKTKALDSSGNIVDTEKVTRYFNGKEAIDDDDYAVVVNDNRYTRVTEEDLKYNRDADITNDIITINPYEAFNRVLLALYVNFSIKEVELEEPAPEMLGEKLATVTYHKRDGDVKKLEVYRKDDRYAYSYINGEYAGGCIKTTGLFGEEYLLYDYKAAIKCLKIVMDLLP